MTSSGYDLNAYTVVRLLLYQSTYNISEFEQLNFGDSV